MYEIQPTLHAHRTVRHHVDQLRCRTTSTQSPEEPALPLDHSLMAEQPTAELLPEENVEEPMRSSHAESRSMPQTPSSVEQVPPAIVEDMHNRVSPPLPPAEILWKSVRINKGVLTKRLDL